MTETERLRVYPAAREAMEAAVAAEHDAALRAAYAEMLEGCLNHPGQWNWYAMWMIERRDGTHVGDLCFKGPPANGAVEIGYGILKEYRGRGYATEAVRAAVAWAFEDASVAAVEAEAETDNAASRRVLSRCGFVPDGTVGEEGPRYVLTRRRFEN